jgi:MFS family permease
MTDEKKTDIMSYGLFAMVITHALVHAAGAMRNSILPLVKEEFFLTNTQVGLIAAVPPLAQALLSIPAGYWSDRYGAKRLVALSIGMAVIGAILGGVTWSPWVFIVATTLLTLNSTFYHPPSHNYVARLVRRVDRSKALGFLNAGGTFGIAVGPLSITLVIEWLGFSWRELYLFWLYQ